MAEFFINWTTENPLSNATLGDLERELRANPIKEVVVLSRSLRATYDALNFPPDFEERNRETGHVKDDHQ